MHALRRARIAALVIAAVGPPCARQPRRSILTNTRDLAVGQARGRAAALRASRRRHGREPATPRTRFSPPDQLRREGREPRARGVLGRSARRAHSVARAETTTRPRTTRVSSRARKCRYADARPTSTTTTTSRRAAGCRRAAAHENDERRRRPRAVRVAFVGARRRFIGGSRRGDKHRLARREFFQRPRRLIIRCASRRRREPATTPRSRSLARSGAGGSVPRARGRRPRAPEAAARRRGVVARASCRRPARAAPPGAVFGSPRSRRRAFAAAESPTSRTPTAPARPPPQVESRGGGREEMAPFSPRETERGVATTRASRDRGPTFAARASTTASPRGVAGDAAPSPPPASLALPRRACARARYPATAALAAVRARGAATTIRTARRGAGDVPGVMVSSADGRVAPPRGARPRRARVVSRRTSVSIRAQMDAFRLEARRAIRRSWTRPPRTELTASFKSPRMRNYPADKYRG